MKQIDVAKRNYPVDKANKQYARESDVDEILKPPFHLTADGRRIASAIIMDLRAIFSPCCRIYVHSA